MENRIDKLTLGLVFTRGMSLKKWQDLGILSREIAVYNLLAKKIKEIYFFSYGGKEEEIYRKQLAPNIKIITNRFRIGSSLYSFLSPFINFRLFRRCQILKNDQMDGSWTAIIAKIIHRNKIVVRSGYTWSSFVKASKISSLKRYIILSVVTSVEKISSAFADQIIFSSRHDQKYSQEKYKTPIAKANYIPNYINTDIFKPSGYEKSRDIIFVGRIAPQKNILTLLKALVGTGYHLTIVGLGALRQDLEKFAKNTKVKIEIIEQVENYQLPKLLSEFKIFVLPSHYEGMPKALLEAMSVGLSCVASDIDGNNEIVTNNQNGFLFDADNVDGLKAIISQLMGDDDLRERIGSAARKTIIDNYSLKTNINSEIKIYENLVQ